MIQDKENTSIQNNIFYNNTPQNDINQHITEHNI